MLQLAGSMVRNFGCLRIAYVWLIHVSISDLIIINAVWDWMSYIFLSITLFPAASSILISLVYFYVLNLLIAKSFRLGVIKYARLSLLSVNLRQCSHGKSALYNCWLPYLSAKKLWVKITTSILCKYSFITLFSFVPVKSSDIMLNYTE